MIPVRHIEYKVKLLENEADKEDIVSIACLVKPDWVSDHIQTKVLFCYLVLFIRCIIHVMFNLTFKSTSHQVHIDEYYLGA